MAIPIVVFDALPRVRVFNAERACELHWRFVRLNRSTVTVAQAIGGCVKTRKVPLAIVHYEACSDCPDYAPADPT